MTLIFHLPHEQFLILLKLFNSQRALYNLSGLTSIEDSGLERQAVRFAARSENISELSKEEQKLLDEFVKYLVENYNE